MWIGIVLFLLAGDKLAFNLPKNKRIGFWFISLSKWGFISIDLVKKRCTIKIAKMFYLIKGKVECYNGNVQYLNVKFVNDDDEKEEELKKNDIKNVENSDKSEIGKSIKTSEVMKIKKGVSFKSFYIHLDNCNIVLLGVNSKGVLSGSIIIKKETGWFHIKT